MTLATARRSTALAVLVLSCVSAPRLDAQDVLARDGTLTHAQQLARSAYKELVEINTVDSVGDVTRAARAMQRRFLAAGFPRRDVLVLVPPGHPDKGNLVVRYRARRGAPAAKPILLLAHLDVVAANRADWPRDPFIMREEGGFFLGRGTSDDKAMAAIFAANLLLYHEAGWQPDRDIILALTADEESETLNGVQWLLANHRPLIDAAYAINEGGGGLLLGDRAAANMMNATEKVYLDLTLTATNAGGHSSVPRADNAIYALSAALGRLSSFQFPATLNVVTRGFFEQTAAIEPRPDIAAAMRRIAASGDAVDADAATILSRDPYFSALLRTTCVPTRLAGGHAYNALPQTATANVNCRVMPSSTAEEVRATLTRVVADTGVHVTFRGALTEKFGVVPTPIDPRLLAEATRLTHEMWGNIPVVPIMSTGASDGRYLRAAGIPTFGVDGMFTVPGESNEHGRDEKLRVRAFYEGQAFLGQLVKAITTAH